MSYGLIYTVPFATLDNIPCVVEVEKEGYIGASMELTAGDTPFSVDITDDEFLYIPTRFSTAKLQVVGKDYLQSIFSTEYRQYRVTFKKDGIITWCGFVKPELYTQDYSSETFVLEIECISAMSVLEFIDYTTEGENKEFVSLWRLLQRCIEASYGQYNTVYLPFVYAKTKEDYIAGANVIEAMTISEQDFFDEDDKPMKLREVLEEVCKFLNWTCVDWKGELYFVDVDHTGMYHRYDASLITKINAEGNSFIIRDNDDYAGDGHLFDILPGFNKVTVKCSNYPVGTIFPNEDFDVLKVIDTYDFSSVSAPSGNDYTKVHNLILLPQVFSPYYYLFSENGNADMGILPGWNDVSEDFYQSLPPVREYDVAGTKFLKRCDITMKDGEPTVYNYDYKDIIFINPVEKIDGNLWNTRAVLPIGKPLLILGQNTPCAMYIDGAIAINMTIKAPGGGVPDKMNFQKVMMYFEMKIGDKYYNGSSWGVEKVYFGAEFENKDRNFEQQNPIKIKNTKTLDMPYNGAEGYIIPIGDIGIVGIPQLTIVGFFARGSDAYDTHKYQIGCFVEDIEVKYFRKETGYYSVSSGDNTDRTYENVLNENYINELDDIELKISSYNDDGVCYGKVVLGDNYLTDNLYNAILDKTKRPEELLITRIINHYSAPRIKLTQVIKNSDDISPLTILSDTFLVNKKFINAGGSIDYKMNRFECVMIEK